MISNSESVSSGACNVRHLIMYLLRMRGGVVKFPPPPLDVKEEQGVASRSYSHNYGVI